MSIQQNSELWLEKKSDNRFQEWLAKQCRRQLVRRLQSIDQGELVLIDGDCSRRFGTPESGQEPIRLQVFDRQFYIDLVLGGSIAAGETYMAGYWRVNDLTRLMRLIIHHRATLNDMDAGLSRWQTPLRRVLHWLNRNSRSGSRRNIAAHYDLGNDFYRLMLDDTMMYSCAWFASPDTDLYTASRAKNTRIIEKLQLSGDHHLLEIGTGWGAFAIQAVQETGCRVTTTTLSEEQYALACQRVREAGLEDRITVLQQDYRELQGRYDRLVSIEMIEAVGHQYFDSYFQCCQALLKPGGRMVLQSITIADELYVSAIRSVDFIQRYIFPGGCLPSVEVLYRQFSGNGFQVTGMERMGHHYAQTLRHWRQRFLENLPEVRGLGYSDRFIHMWEFYLCYCEAGFDEKTINTVQVVADK